jgi:hypothetical protein
MEENEEMVKESDNKKAVQVKKTLKKRLKDRTKREGERRTEMWKTNQRFLCTNVKLT